MSDRRPEGDWVHWHGTVIPAELRVGDRINGALVVDVDEFGVVVEFPALAPPEILR